MSGGSFNYICHDVEYRCCGRMRDRELNDMMKDLVEVLHDVEWYVSGDIDWDDYQKTVGAFKQKWFKGDREERYKDYLKQEYEQLVNELNYTSKEELIES